MQNYQYHSSYLTQRAATLLLEIPKPESVDTIIYRSVFRTHFE